MKTAGDACNAWIARGGVEAGLGTGSVRIGIYGACAGAVVTGKPAVKERRRWGGFCFVICPLTHATTWAQELVPGIRT